jgi:small neutral amino acid transporter SnatA (MarC family)
VALRLAQPIFGLLGRTCIQVLGRVLGLVLAGIAVQFVLNGLRASEIVSGAPP